MCSACCLVDLGMLKLYAPMDVRIELIWKNEHSEGCPAHVASQSVELMYAKYAPMNGTYTRNDEAVPVE